MSSLNAYKVSSYNKQPNDTNKLYCNTLVSNAYIQYVKKHTDANIALVLDDEHFQSSVSLKKHKLKIHIAQFDSVTFTRMKNKQPSNVVKIVMGNYDVLSIPSLYKKIVIDHSDFCSGWYTNRYILERRFKLQLYANRAILRITVSYRGAGKGVDSGEYTRIVMSDLQIMCQDTAYMVKPLSIRQLDKKHILSGIDESDSEYVSFAYGTMLNIVCLIIEV